MREMALRPENERRDVFRAAAQAMRVHEAIIEKDFWVCWTLACLFHESPWKDAVGFKGGTSLSKAFGAIPSFGEILTELTALEKSINRLPAADLPGT